METDRFEPSKKARASMLRRVYEENRRIQDGGAAEAAERRRNTTLAAVAGVLVLLVLVIGIQMAGEEPVTDAEPVALGATTILDANLPVVDTGGEMEGGLDPAEFREMLSGSTPLAALFDLQVRTIVLDPGHGGEDPGAVGINGTYEKDVTLDVALRLKRRLEQRGYTVLMTRGADETVSLRERVEYANQQPTDLFVSIHANSFPDAPVNALETYYFGANTERTLLRLAEAENSGSDYTLADFNDMIRRLASTVKLQESRRLAVSVQRSLVSNTRIESPDVQDWGVKAGPFVVLLGSDAPSILAEISVLTNSDQADRLQSGAHREQLASFLEEGVLNYLVDRSRRQSTPTQ
ncbi:MAG: N-acetylmuramoyl-L-alanine amidase [Rhodothermales bacterium]|nr:N-acetylmuramoyl-L-alanine amidase [Rhodothermales bacterium]